MLKILGRISIYGTKENLEKLQFSSPILNGTIKQVGTLRKVPEDNSWCYASPWYRFHQETLDEEILDFISVNDRLGFLIYDPSINIEYAVFSISPVGQNYQESFAFILSPLTLEILSHCRLSFELTPASVMPDAPFWSVVRASTTTPSAHH